MYKILVVDDEERIRTLIHKYAEFEQFDVVETSDGMDAINLCRSNTFDIIIMDIMMPEIDGYTACSKIREFCNTPIIMLSARGEEYDRIHGFEVGVDDYVVKPFSVRELMMRVKAIIARKGNNNSEHEVFTKEGLSVDFTGRIVYVDGNEVSMTPKEYELLFYFIRNRGVALTRDRLITEIWGYDYLGDDRTLDTHIKLLRSSLGTYRRFLVTLRGVGYRFEA